MRRIESKNKNNKFIKIAIISIVIAIIYELILKLLFKKNDTIHVYNIIVESGIFLFILAHFFIGFRKLYDYIIKKRFVLSIILIVLSSIVGIMQHSNNLKSWIFETNTVLSIFWNIKFYVLLLVSFELFSSFIDNKYISMVGTVLIAFSGCVQWNPNIVLTIISGELIVVLLNRLLMKNKPINIVLYSLIFGVLLLIFFNSNRMAAISFGYVYFALIVWSIIKNKDNIKINTLIKLIILTIIVYLLLHFVFIKNLFGTTKLVVNSNENGIQCLFSYIFNILLPYRNTNTKAIYGSFFSIFPIPMLMALYYIFNHEEHLEFLLPVTVASVIGTIVCISGIPNIIKHVLLFENVNISYIAMAVNYANLLLLFYMAANIDEKIFGIKVAMRITIVCCCLMIFLKFPSMFETLPNSTIYIVEFASTVFLFLSFDDKKYKKALMFLLIVFVLIGGVPVNSLTVRDRNNNYVMPADVEIQK